MDKTTPNHAGRRERRYLTTTIPYVNAAPHIGFALELVQADVLARLYRQQGHDVRLQAGTDENSLKNVRAAEAAGVLVEELIARNADLFRQLGRALDITVDDFIRTSADPRHRPGVEKLWAACAARGDVYKRAYRGLYCTGCEQFYKPSELVDGCCPEHGTPPEEVTEENWFFRLSRYQDELRRLIVAGELEIVPETRLNEVLAWIDGRLDDFSISRCAARARGWGIPVPGDPDQVVYVWFDALGNYITALGYGSDGEHLERWWHQATTREHVLGKGVTRFHAVYWPAILLSAGLPLPTRILIHGYVTVGGRKIGKSAGNAIDPVPLADELGADALRYYLLRHIRSSADGDFSRDRFLQAYDSELAGQLGNLAHRTLTLIDRHCNGVVPSAPVRVEEPRIITAVARLPDQVLSLIHRYDFNDALIAIWDLVSQANRYITEKEPWALAKATSSGASPSAAAATRRDLDACLSDLARVLVTVGRCLVPFLPSTSARLLSQLGVDVWGADTCPGGRRISSGEILFPRRPSG